MLTGAQRAYATVLVCLLASLSLLAGYGLGYVIL
jgi:hypothetical protein